MTETGTKAVPLSKYSQNDLVTAFQKKASEAQSNTQQLKNFHESYQVCFSGSQLKITHFL